MAVGVSGPVAALILITALVAQGSALFTAQRNSDAVVEQARDAWQRRHEASLAHRVAIDNASWDASAGRVNLTLNNTGSVALNASRVQVLLDGAPAAASAVASRQVEGVATDVWAPGQRLDLRVTAGSKPVDVAAVSPYGTVAAWRGL